MKVQKVESYYAAQIQLASIKIHTKFLRLYGMNLMKLLIIFTQHREFQSLNIQEEFQPTIKKNDLKVNC